MSKVLITGHKGYIGSHLVRILKNAGHTVSGCDIHYFPDCEWEPLEAPYEEFIQDYRKLERNDLEDFDCICHLAAISNDPMGDLDPSLTMGVNCEGSIELARKARDAGVSRFLFSSSCSVYGKGESLDLDENAKLNPVSVYARSKIEAEAGLGKLASDEFSPAYLRNATAYGHSPALRIDLVVNNLLGCAIARGEIHILSDGTPWRPLIHCEDIARAFAAFMEAPRENIHNKAINVGGNNENYQVKTVADCVQEILPEAKITYAGETAPDPRDYRVNFDQLNKLLPHFTLRHDLGSGTRQLYEKYLEHGFDEEAFAGSRFVRLKTLKNALMQ